MMLQPAGRICLGAGVVGLGLMQIVNAGFDAATVDRVLRLVRIAEWKRQQAAPGPKVSRRAFGRERRYPITNAYTGGMPSGRR